MSANQPLPPVEAPGNEPPSDPAQGAAKSLPSDLRLALNAVGIVIFPITWPFFVAGIWRGDPATRRTGRFVLLVLGLIVAIVVVQTLTR
jgi:hypothetical protein